MEALAETAVDIGSCLNRFLDPVADASAEITALIAECFSISSALRILHRAVQDFEYDPRSARIRGDVAIVKESLQFTFGDVERIVGLGLRRTIPIPRIAYRDVWSDIAAFFHRQSGNTLCRRLSLYRLFIQELTWTLTEGAPRNIERLEDLKFKIERLLDAQEAADEEARLAEDFERTSLGRPPSFERRRPAEDRLRDPAPQLRGGRAEPVRRASNPPVPMDFEEFAGQRPRSRDHLRRVGGLRVPMEHEGFDGRDPWRRDPRSRRDDRMFMEDDFIRRDDFGRREPRYPPAAPEVPLSPTTSATYSSHSSSSRDQGPHWLRHAWEQSLPTTALETMGQSSVALGTELGPEARDKLLDEYVRLLELPFDGDLTVRLYQRPEDGKARMLCRTLPPTRSRKDCCIQLTALDVERSGPFLRFLKPSQSRRSFELWACLKFTSYEKLVLFFCTFLALRSEDAVNPMTSIVDFDMRHESILFSGRIVDDHYEHTLRLLMDKTCGGIRLQASVLSGDLKKTPVWTAFITHQIHSPRWMTKASSKVIHLTDLQRYIFTEDYQPQVAPDGEHELSFTDPRDAKKFRRAISELRVLAGGSSGEDR